MKENTAIPETSSAGVPPERLKRALTLRHIMFIALGSAIGTGLFYGSAGAISLGGPAVLLAYLIGGGAVFLVMRAMGEMALASPVPGAFSEYATRYLGRWAGFVTGWSYAFEMALVAIADVTAFAVYMQLWFPGTPAWVWITSVILIIMAVQLVQVKAFGETEFWFTIIKVGAIVAMIIGGVLLLIVGTRMHAEVAPSVANLWEQGGFFATGLNGFLLCFVAVMFAFGGIETIGIAAGEAKNPRVSIPKAIRTVPVRILLFYVCTLAVVMSLYPWSSISKENGSPFVQIFAGLGVAPAADILNFVVITAAVSAINADVYGAGRMLYGMAARGLAPASFTKVARNGNPWMTTVCMGIVLVVGVVVNTLFEKAFTLLMGIATFATVMVWVMILLSHAAFKRKVAAGTVKVDKDLPVNQPLWQTYAALGFMAFVVVIMFFSEENLQALVVGAAWCIFLLVYYPLVLKKRTTVDETTGISATDNPQE